MLHRSRRRCAQAYASLYTGRTRGSRLLFAAERGGPGLELEALRLAAEHAKQGEDTQFYVQARFVSRVAAPVPYAPTTLPAVPAPAADARALAAAGDGEDQRAAGPRQHAG